VTYTHSMCNINYHFVWCTKYRKKVLTNVDDLKDILHDVCKKYKWTIKGLEIMSDHVHIFISTPPYDAPSKIAKILKGRSARLMFRRHPELRNELWGGHLWSPSYYCGTAGHVSSEAITKYIENQKKGEKGNSSPD